MRAYLRTLKTLGTLGSPKGDDAAAIDKGGYRQQVQETLVLALFLLSERCLMHE